MIAFGSFVTCFAMGMIKVMCPRASQSPGDLSSSSVGWAGLGEWDLQPLKALLSCHFNTLL